MSGIVYLQTQFKEYATDALMKAASSSLFNSGESVYSKQSGLYQFSRRVASLGASDLASDDGLGSFIKISNPIIYIDDSQYISPLNVHETTLDLTNGKIWIGQATGLAGQVTPSGHGTISNTGVINITAVAANTITSAMLYRATANSFSLTGNLSMVSAFVDGGSYSYLNNWNDAGGSTSGAMGSSGAAKKCYFVNINVNRPTTAAVTGDSNDSILKMSYRNYAVNDSNFIMRSINTSLNNGASDGSVPGTVGILEGFSLGVKNSSGSTAPTIRGGTIRAENYGTNATEFGVLDLNSSDEVGAATTRYVLRLRNTDASSVAAMGSALLISNTSTNGFTYGIDMNGSSCLHDIRLDAGMSIDSGAGVPSHTAAKGTLYLRTNGTTTNDRAYINTDGATTWTALTTAA